MELSFRAYNTMVDRFTPFTLQEIEKQKGQIQWHIIKVDLFTGIRDKKGKRIYQNDIIKITEFRGDKVVSYTTPVIWEDCSFVVRSGSDDYDTFLAAWSGDPKNTTPRFELEIIGNMHQNKELSKNTTLDKQRA